MTTVAHSENARSDAPSAVQSYARLAEFTRARIRLMKWVGSEVATRADALGNPYVSRRSLSHATSASWVGVPEKRTLLGLDLALRLPPGTLRVVMSDPEHKLDPAMPEWTPPPLARYDDLLSSAEREAAQRIADRAAEAS